MTRVLPVVLALVVGTWVTHAQPGESRMAYEKKRAALVQRASAEGFDADIRLSAAEQKANARFTALRDSLLAVAHERGDYPWSRYFYGVKEEIQRSPMFALLRSMPKGIITHIHTSATGSMRWVVRTAVAEPECFVRWHTPDPAKKGTLRFFKQGKEEQGYVQAAELARSVPGFEDSLYALLTFDHSMGDDTARVWTEFERRFDRIDGFESFKPVSRRFYRMAFDSLIADGVQSVELRAGLGALYDLDHPYEPNDGYYNSDSTLALFTDLEREIRREHPSFTLKIIISGYRFHPPDRILAGYANAFRLRKLHPDIVKGYDLVGEEDGGNATRYYLDAWLKTDSLRRAFGVDLPLYFHDGESDRPEVDNLYDAVLLGSRRIGHGFNLFQHPSLIAEVKRRDICVEVSPLSNQILGYVRDLRTHPACGMLRQGVQCTISSDDPGIFGYSGMTYDFWSAVMAWRLDLRAVKKLALNSIRYGALTPAEKAEAMNVFENRWKGFVATLQ